MKQYLELMKRVEGTFDVDNAIKATLDGLTGVAYPDDRMVYHVEATKL